MPHILDLPTTYYILVPLLFEVAVPEYLEPEPGHSERLDLHHQHHHHHPVLPDPVKCPRFSPLVFHYIDRCLLLRL